VLPTLRRSSPVRGRQRGDRAAHAYLAKLLCVRSLMHAGPRSWCTTAATSPNSYQQARHSLLRSQHHGQAIETSSAPGDRAAVRALMHRSW